MKGRIGSIAKIFTLFNPQKNSLIIFKTDSKQGMVITIPEEGFSSINGLEGNKSLFLYHI